MTYHYNNTFKTSWLLGNPPGLILHITRGTMTRTRGSQPLPAPPVIQTLEESVMDGKAEETIPEHNAVLNLSRFL